MIQNKKDFKHFKKVFISGKITGEEEYKTKFKVAQLYLENKGHIVMNPAVLPQGFEHQDYMEICYKMIDACDAVVFLNDWGKSQGAKLEQVYSEETKTPTFLFDEIIKEEALDQLIDLRDEKRENMLMELDPDSVYFKDYMALEWALKNLS